MVGMNKCVGVQYILLHCIYYIIMMNYTDMQRASHYRNEIKKC